MIVEREAAEGLNTLPIDLNGRQAAARTRLAAWPAAAAAGACSRALRRTESSNALRRLFDGSGLQS